MKKTIILVHGLPGAGKTTLSDLLARLLSAARVNADDVRSNINTDLGFEAVDRVEHARRMAHISRIALSGLSQIVVVDFVCPTTETRQAFIDAIDHDQYDLKIIYMDTIEESRFTDTNSLFQRPDTEFDSFETVRIDGYIKTLESFEDYAESIACTFFGPLGWNIIRFNTECNEDPSIEEKWRLINLDTNEEICKVRSFQIVRSPTVPVRTERDGVEKWNIGVYARAQFDDHGNVTFV